MIDLQTIPRLGKNSLLAYEKWLAIKAERSRLQARLEELEEAQKDQEYIFSKQFDETHDSRRIPGNRILQQKFVTVADKLVTQEMVGTVVRKGYSFTTYKEVDL